MNILVTGGCGFVGSNIAISLQKEGHNLTCMDNLSRRGSEKILKRILSFGCEFIHGDIRNKEDFIKLKDHYDIMVECSAEPSVLAGTKGEEALSLLNNNLMGFINCIDYCRIHKTAIIFLSTSRVYPHDKIESFDFIELETRFEINNKDHYISKNGIKEEFPLAGIRSLYGASKLAAEYLLIEYSNNYNIPAIINRFGVIAGPWQLGKVDQGVFTFWLVNHYFKKSLKYIGYGGKGKQVRDLLHIDDLIALIKIQISSIKKYRGDIFNAGGGTFSSLSLKEATVLCEKITGNKVKIEPVVENRPADLIWYVTNNARVTAEFGWKPEKSPEIILKDIYIWLRENESAFRSIFNFK